MAIKAKRPTIGFLIDQIHGMYHKNIWNGVADAAEIYNVNLIIYCGKCLNIGEFYEYNENLVYSLINLNQVDGLLLSSGSLANFISKDQFMDFIKPYMKKPLVSYSMLLPGIPSICADNKAGMKEVVNHLINIHGIKRIAYINGPETNIDARIRFQAYREALCEHNIPVDENLILPGNFLNEGGKRAIHTLLDERKIKCDAIICANDGMALGALQVLTEKKINVPGDIALIGFDDSEDVKFSSPPLTSVHQPVREMSEKGVQMLVDLIAGKMVEEQVVFPAYPVIRQSCGCLPLPEKIIKKSAKSTLELKKLPAINKEKYTSIAREICTHLGLSPHKKNQYIQYITGLLIRLVEDIVNNRSTSSFLHYLNEILSEMVFTRKETLSWQNILYFIRGMIIPDFRDAEDLKRAEELFHKAQIHTGKMYELKEGFQKCILSHEDEFLRDLYTRVHYTVEQEKLPPIIVSALQHFRIQRCFLSLFENPLYNRINPFELDPRIRSRLFIAVQGDQAEIHGHDGPPFPSRNLVPDGYIPQEERFSWLVRVLYSQEIKFGFVIFDLNTRAENVLVSLHDMFCSGLMMTRMYKQRTIAEKELKARTKELEGLNKKLEELDNLKNEFIANITHDFRSTLMVILNTADIGIKYYSIKGSMLAKRFTTIFNASLKLKSTIDKLLELGKMDTRGIKLKVRKVDLKKFMESIIDFYKSTAMYTKIKVIDILPPGKIRNVYTDTEKLEDVLYNILSNAFKFVDSETGIIKIECKDKKDTVLIIISDNGIGVPPDKLEDIFKRFVQIDRVGTPRFKGTGIGLAFARQLMVYLKGKIWAESEGEGKGTRFYVELKKGKNIFSKEDFYDTKTEPMTISEDRENLIRILQMQISNKTKGDGFTVMFRSLNTEEEYDYHKGIILIIEDNEYIRNIEREYLERTGYINFILARDGRSGIHAAYSYRPDIIICDYNMPNMKGDEFHDKLMNNLDFVSIPIIFITAVTDRKVIIERRKKGAIAVLAKPLNENDFLLTVDVSLKRYMEYRKTLQQANIDELTGLNNRQTILRNLKDQILSRTFQHISLIFFDIDHFKQFNDAYGHQAGDKVLAALGATVKKSIRICDLAGRYGGEEFLVILPDTTIKGALIVAKKLKKEISAIQILLEGKNASITASFGISSLIDNKATLCKILGIENLKQLYETTGTTTSDLEKINERKSRISELLISMADQAMYKAKSTTCTSCGFSSEKEKFFTRGNCPQCKKTALIKGRNRIVLWEDEE